MGYLSQKKKYIRIRELLKLSLILSILVCVAILFFKTSVVTEFINHWLFQIYIYVLFVAIYAAYYKFFSHMLMLLAVSFILFLNLGRGSNIFVPVETVGTGEFKILYQKKAKDIALTERQIVTNNIDVAGIINGTFSKIEDRFPDYNLSFPSENMIITPYNINRSGEILLSKHNKAGFAEIKKAKESLIFIMLDFSGSQLKERKTALKNLAKFVNMQDAPVLIVGDFGIEAWSPNFIRFMEKTGLEVKNTILLRQADLRFNPFVSPTINILAYKNFGIRDLIFLSSTKQNTSAMFITLNY